MTTPKNPYLMEKQKSFETVYELKSETPSFEEFANSYECDENISNIYHLENQSQEKGYGSCIDGRSETYCHCSIEDIRIQIINNTYYVLKRPSPPDHHRIRVNFFTSFSDEYFFSNSAFWLDIGGDVVGWDTANFFSTAVGASNICKHTQDIKLKNFAQLKKFKELLEIGATPDSSNHLPQIIILEWGNFTIKALRDKTQGVANKVRELIAKCEKWENIDGDFEF